MTYTTPVFTLIVFIEAIIILLGGLTLYIYKKLEILHKPPGSLILTELVILFLLQIEDLLYFISYHIDYDSYNIYGVFIYLYGYMCCVLYEDCIAFEVLLRLQNSPMGKNYKRRARLYHVLCNLLASAYTAVLIYYREDIYKDGDLVYEYDKPACWILICMPGSLLVISIVIILICIRLNRKERNTTKRNYLSYVMLYLFTITFIKLGNLLFELFYYQIFDKREIELSTVVAVITLGLDSLVFIVRFLEPNIRRYLQSCFVYYRAKMRYYCRQMCKRSQIKDTVLNSGPNCHVSLMFEELERETIEYQLIATSIILFKSYFGTCIASINTTNDPDYYPKEIQAIKSHDLVILNDSSLEAKCNIYTDSDFYCEYKLYSPIMFKQIIYNRGLCPSDIANSLLIQDNFENIMTYTKENYSKTFYYSSADKKYALQFLSKSKLKRFINEILPKYHDRILEDSLLQYIYGVFKLVIKGQVYRIMIMEHINIQQDLGSRLCSLPGFERSLDDSEEQMKLKLDKEDKEEIIKILRKDMEFLKEAGIEYCNLVVNYSNQPLKVKCRRYSGMMEDLTLNVEIRIGNLKILKKKKENKKLRKSASGLNKVSIDRLEEILNHIIE